MLHTALALAEKGLAVFPCASASKKPACTHGCLEATTDIITINAWWHENPRFNVAIATGTVSKIFVIDLDGVEAENALAALGQLPPTITVITARGRHIYFRLPSGIIVRNSAGKLAADVDVRGDGGYVLSPPSVHPDGSIYKWATSNSNTFADPPLWLLNKAIEAGANGNGHCTPASEWRELITAGIREGQRNSTVTRLTGHLLRHYVDPHVTLELMQVWNTVRCNPPLPATDISTIVNSVAGRELKRRTRGR
jgi:hypothetical protein